MQLSLAAPLPPQLSPEAIEERLRGALLLSARLQLLISVAFVWLILIFATLPGGAFALESALALTAWIVLTSLLLSLIAIWGKAQFVAGPLPGYLAIAVNLGTMLLATLLIWDTGSDLFLVYFFPIGVATAYYGLRGGGLLAVPCIAAYLLVAVAGGGPLDQARVWSLLVRSVFLMTLPAAFGVATEGHFLLIRRLRAAYQDLRNLTVALRDSQANLNRRIDEMVTLNDVGREFTRSLNPAMVLQTILSEVKRVVQVEAATLMLLDPVKGELIFHIPLGEKGGGLGGTRLPLTKGIAGWVARTGQSLRVDDVRQDPRFFSGIDRTTGFATRSILCVPIELQGKCLGVIEVMNKDVAAFDEDDRRLLSSFAQWAAIAIENSRLYDDLNRSMEQLKQAQGQLVQGARLKALGEMAGGVAHDFNNLLTIILGQAQMLALDLTNPEQVNSVRQIEHAARDGAAAVRRIQDFTRVRQDQPTGTFPLARLVAEGIDITRPRWANLHDCQVQILTDLSFDAHVAGSAPEIREVLTNLILNAVDAMPHGGQIWIELRPCGQDRVQILVRDNGTGMSPAVRDRVFDPYFTTKAQGTGLGLSVAYGIVHRHGGTISVESTEGEGTCFTITLPTAVPGLPETPAEQHVAQSHRFRRVLLVDDDLGVLNASRSLLDIGGYEVQTATSASQVIQEHTQGRCDVVFTDLSMPDMSGWDLARELKQRAPAIPIILVTGWGLQVDPKRMSEGYVDGVLAKPFMLDQVVELLSDLERRGNGKSANPA